MPALHISNEEACRLIRELAELEGRSMTAVVLDAVKDRLEQKRKPRISGEVIQYWTEFGKQARAATPPDLLALDPDELLYDEHGAPK